MESLLDLDAMRQGVGQGIVLPEIFEPSFQPRLPASVPLAVMLLDNLHGVSE